MGQQLPLVAALLLLSACATLPEGGHRHAFHRSPPMDALPGTGGSGGCGSQAARAVTSGTLVQLDGFESLLAAAELHERALLSCGPLSPEEARRLHGLLLTTPSRLRSFGPRLVASSLLREVIAGAQPVPRSALVERVARFRRIAVLRPDGYLAWSLTGDTAQRAGPLAFHDGALRAGPFELGRFYLSNGWIFQAVNDQLELQDLWPLAEVYDDSDLINRALDGAQEAVIAMAVAFGGLIVHPIRSIGDLARLPQGLALLIQSSPAYFERFQLMTQGEQIQALARISTTLILSAGGTAGATRQLSSAARGLGSISIPALSLSVNEALVLQQVSVPVGTMATALSGGPGALYILHMANQAAGEKWTPPSEGPGEWLEVNESMKPRARKYQSQISQAPEGYAYRVKRPGMDKVDFDGFRDGVLLEAKGPGYAHFLKGGEFEWWFQGAEKIVTTAERQVKAANGTPIQWHVAEREAVDAIRALLKDNGYKQIEVIYTPPLP